MFWDDKDYHFGNEFSESAEQFEHNTNVELKCY